MRKCDTTKYKNKKWFKLYEGNEIKEYINSFYIKENHSFEELKTELQCSEGKLLNILKEFDISKPKNLVGKKIVETRLKNGNGLYETQETQLKKRETCLSKYGVADYMKSKEFQHKRKNTMINKYGAEYTMKASKLKAKVEQTNLERYGYKNAFQNEWWQHNMGGSKASWSQSARNLRQLNYEKQGLNKSNWSSCTFNILKNKDSFCKYLEELPDENRTITFIANDLDVIYDNIRNRYIKWNLYNTYPLQQFRSLPEIEITKYIKSIYDDDILINTRSIITPYELDIYLPNLNIAIEYNGEFWHKNKLDIDDKKKLMCEKNNINLYVIKEREYITNKNKVFENIQNLIKGGEKPCQQI